MNNDRSIICKKCKTTKPISEFGKYQIKGRKKKNSRKTCNLCRCRAQQLRYKNNPEVAAKVKKAAIKHRLSKVYNITIEEYDAMLVNQNNKCKICDTTPDKKLNIDHCHKTNKVRGLLCWPCNIALGHFKDNIDLLDTLN